MVPDTSGRGGGALWPLVAALQKVPCLAELGERNFVVRMLFDRLGEQLSVAEDAKPVRHLFNIAEACRRHPDGLAALRDVLAYLDGGSVHFGDVDRLIQQMAAPHAWTRADRERIFDLLRGVVVPDLPQTYRLVAGPTAPDLLPGDTARDAFRLLETLNAGPDGLPMALVFVERVAAVVARDLAVAIRNWADSQAARLDLTDELQAVRVDSERALPVGSRPRSPAYLVFLLQREGPRGNRFRLCHWRQLDVSGGWHPERVPDYTDHYDKVRTRVAELIEWMEGEWAEYQPDIRVEFVLSGELLNLDVDQWPWESDSPWPEPVGCRFSVVVRDLERMNARKWHRLWRNRWQALNHQLASRGAVAVESSFWSTASGEQAVREITAAFDRSSSLVALVLSAPPRQAAYGRAEIVVGLRAGVPLMLWDRVDCESDGFRAVARDLLHGDGADPLLERVRLARAAAFAVGSGERHVGGRLTLLWDDPDRVVVPEHVGPPEEVTVA